MKYRLRIKKPIAFSWRLVVEKMQKWSFFESDTVSLREVWNGEDNEQSEMFKGKLKTFKNWLICAKHAIFATESSRE